MNIEPKRSCVVSKPECVKYNYVIPENYLKEGFKNAKIENQILENELEILDNEKSQMHSQFISDIDRANMAQHRLITKNNELISETNLLRAEFDKLKQLYKKELYKQVEKLRQKQLIDTQLFNLIEKHQELQTAHRALEINNSELIIKLTQFKKTTEHNMKFNALNDELIEAISLIQKDNDLLINDNNLLKETEEGLNLSLNATQGDLIDLNTKYKVLKTAFDELVKKTDELVLLKSGGSRHKNPLKRSKTHKRRSTRRLRAKKIPRKCFTRRKREKK